MRHDARRAASLDWPVPPQSRGGPSHPVQLAAPGGRTEGAVDGTTWGQTRGNGLGWCGSTMQEEHHQLNSSGKEACKGSNTFRHHVRRRKVPKSSAEYPQLSSGLSPKLDPSILWISGLLIGTSHWVLLSCNVQQRRQTSQASRPTETQSARIRKLHRPVRQS